MATITFTIADADLDRVVTAWAGTYGWDELSGLTKAQFTKQDLVGRLKEVVRQYERRTAIETAATNADGSFTPPDIT